MCTKFQFREAKKCQWVVTGLPIKYHPIVATLLTPDYDMLSDDFRGNRNELICLILETKFGNDP